MSKMSHFISFRYNIDSTGEVVDENYLSKVGFTKRVAQ